MADITYVAGLDLSHARDFTALAILERTRPDDPSPAEADTFRVHQTWAGIDTIPVRPATLKRERTYAVRHLERFPLGTSYPAICARVVELFEQPLLAGTRLVVDQTGIGRAVVDMIRRARPQATIGRSQSPPVTRRSPTVLAGTFPRKSWSACCKCCCNRAACRWRAGCRWRACW